MHHDDTFKRLFKDGRRSTDLTLEEAKQLTFVDVEPMASLNEVLDTTKSKIKIYMELKGKTADPQMADDIIKELKERDMLGEVVLVSLKQNLIEYIHQHHPDVQIGFIYFISFGLPGSLTGDYLILEEDMMTDDNLEDIYFRRKKPIVWTVNTHSSMVKSITKGVDGIITDDPELLRKVLEIEINKTAQNRLLEKLQLVDAEYD